jgi:hypothetical protein
MRTEKKTDYKVRKGGKKISFLIFLHFASESEFKLVLGTVLDWSAFCARLLGFRVFSTPVSDYIRIRSQNRFALGKVLY